MDARIDPVPCCPIKPVSVTEEHFHRVMKTSKQTHTQTDFSHKENDSNESDKAASGQVELKVNSDTTKAPTKTIPSQKLDVCTQEFERCHDVLLTERSSAESWCILSMGKHIECNRWVNILNVIDARIK
ncbi:hypothetical protein BgiBS90_021961 [Biomphalaria glabrata]|nr:hypothetical protein BgiBS90_021961 [Biomphalaria glabrata]